MANLLSYYYPTDEGQFEQDCQQNLHQLLIWKLDENKWNKLHELANKGFQEANERNRGKRWPILSVRKKIDISKDLPQAVCILFAFADFYQLKLKLQSLEEYEKPLISAEMRIQFEDVISKLREDVEYNFRPQGEVDIFTKCMVEVKKYVGTDRTKKIVRKKNQGEAFGLEDDIKKRFTFNEAQAFFNDKDLGLPAGECVSILKKLVDSFGKVVGHKYFDQNSNPSNASDILKGYIGTIKKALTLHKIPCRIESKRGVGYVLQHKKTGAR
jgi:hypothetical protein